MHIELINKYSPLLIENNIYKLEFLRAKKLLVAELYTKFTCDSLNKRQELINCQKKLLEICDIIDAVDMPELPDMSFHYYDLVVDRSCQPDGHNFKEIANSKDDLDRFIRRNTGFELGELDVTKSSDNISNINNESDNEIN